MNIVAGHNKWVYRGEINNIYQTEHDEMFAGIRKGKPVYNGNYMTRARCWPSWAAWLLTPGRRSVIGSRRSWIRQEVLGPFKYEWGSAGSCRRWPCWGSPVFA